MLNSVSDVLSGIKDSKTSLTDVGLTETDRPSPAKFAARNQLLLAREILELGLENVSFARQAVALNDIQTVADVSWVKVNTISLSGGQLGGCSSDGSSSCLVIMCYY